MSNDDNFVWWSYPRSSRVGRLAAALSWQMERFTIAIREGNPQLPINAVDQLHALEDTHRELQVELKALDESDNAQRSLYSGLVHRGECP